MTYVCGQLGGQSRDFFVCLIQLATKLSDLVPTLIVGL